MPIVISSLCTWQGVIIVLVSSIPSLVMAFSFQTLPSLSVLIYTIIAVAAVFLYSESGITVTILMGLF